MIETAGPRAHARQSPTPVGGLTAAAAVVLVTVVTLVAALISAATGHGFGAAFNVVYLLVTVYVALRIHVEDRFVAVIAPPLAYAFSLFVAGFFDTTETIRTFMRVIENTFVNLAFGAPWLVGATIAAIVIAVVRGRRASVASHR